MYTDQLIPDRKLFCSINADNAQVRFLISGDIDQVRMAIRDIKFGLHLDNHEVTNIEHVSESLKMIGLSPFPENKAQIDLCIDTSSFKNLVTMFRYCKLIELETPTITELEKYKSDDRLLSYLYFDEVNKIKEDGASVLGFYLANAKRLADSYTVPLVIPAYDQPRNRVYWLQSELALDVKTKLAKYKLSQSNLMLFKINSNDLKGRKASIESRCDNINELVAIMVSNHPRYIPGRPVKYEARDFLEVYKQCKDAYPTKDIYQLTPDEFIFIRQDDRKKFDLLAKKYWQLQAELHELNKQDKPLNKYAY